MKLIYVDTETSGVDPRKNALLSLAGEIEIDGKSQGTFDYRLAPFPFDAIEDEALKVNGFTRQQIAGFPSPKSVYSQFTTLLGKHVHKFNRSDKFLMIGYNSRFDSDAIRAWFEKLGDVYFGSWFWFPPIDVMNMAAWNLRDRRVSMPNFKLHTVAKALAIDVKEESLHEARYDIDLTKRILEKLNEVPA